MLRRQGRRRLAPARADRGARASALRAVLLGRRRARHRRAGQLRRRQRLPRRARRPPAAREGLPATSLAWGLWAQASGMTGDLADADLARLARDGIGALSDEQGSTLFDAARRAGRAAAGRRRRSTAARCARRPARGLLPPLLRGLVARAGRRARQAAARLAGAAAGRAAGARARGGWCSTWCAAQVAAVLGHAARRGDRRRQRASRTSASTRSTAVELRNRLDRGHRPARCRPPWSSTTRRRRRSPATCWSELLGAGTGAQPRSRCRGAARSRRDEPIAIVGMSLPLSRRGRARRRSCGSWSPTGRDAIAAFPTDRGWDLERLFDPDPTRPGKCYAREGGFLDDAAEFDAAFFGISPARGAGDGPAAAAAAGVRLGGAGGRRASTRLRCAAADTGVFAGVMLPGLRAPAARCRPSRGLLAAGAAASVASGRVAYVLGLEGPAVTVDTACSSSLVAMHLAAQALRAGECDLALAGGVTVMADPGHLHRVRPPARPGPRRPLQGRSPPPPTAPAGPRARRAGAGAALRRPAPRPPRPGRDPRLAPSTRTAPPTA